MRTQQYAQWTLVVLLTTVCLLPGCGGATGRGLDEPVGPGLAPTASAGSDRTVLESALVRLTGVAADADGDLASMQWSQLSGPTLVLEGAETATVSFRAPTAPADGPLVLELQFRAIDDGGREAVDAVTVTVQPSDALLYLANPGGDSQGLWRVHVDPGSPPPARMSGRTSVGGYVAQFKLSPDGLHVAYLVEQSTPRSRLLYCMPSTGGVPTRLGTTTNDVSSFLWSPDSRHIAYSADEESDRTYELFSEPVGGGQRTKINAPLVPGGNTSSYAWAPDSTRIAYTAEQEQLGVRELYLAHASNAGTVKLSGPLVEGGNVSRFYWSPTGDRIAYVADQDTENQFDLYSVPAAGGTSVRLNGPQLSGRFVRGAIWVPDGTCMLYSAAERVADEYEVYAVPAAGGARVPLAGAASAPMAFLLAPDGSRVAYVLDSETEGVFELFSVRVNGEGRVKLNGALPVGGHVHRAAWSPDSKRIAYAAAEETRDSIDLYSVLAGGGGGVKLNGDQVIGDLTGQYLGEPIGKFSWSPDSTRVAFHGMETLGVLELHTAPAIGGESVKVSASLVAGRDVRDFRWSPDGTRLAYAADQDTDEVFELFVTQAAGGEIYKYSQSPMSPGLVWLYLWGP